jgi:Cu/Ag efflux pump CusA
MLGWAAQTSQRFRILAVALAVGVLALGVIWLQGARVEVLPEFSPPYVEIQTEALGLSAAEVEQLITVPLEADLLNGVAFLDQIRSESVLGLSSIVMVFEPGTDLYQARQLVAERMTQAHALPNVSKPPVMLEPVSSSSRAMVLGVSSEKLSLIDQSVLARWTIRPRLMGVPGVSNVSVYGQRDRQLQVQVDPATLGAKGLGLIDVLKTAGNATWVSPLTFLEASTPGTGGFIDTPNQRLSIQNISPIVNAGTLAQVAVEGHPGLRLGDVATVVEDHQLLIGDGISSGGNGLMIVIEKFPEANTMEVTEGVEAALQGLAPGLSDMRIDSTVYRPASFVESAMSNLALMLLIGLALAVALIGLLLFSWRAAVIAVVTISVSLATAVVVLGLFGVTMNMLVVLGLVGAVSVLIADAIATARSSGSSVPTNRAAAAALVIVALAVTPAFFLPGSVGAFVAPLAAAFLVGLGAALAVAVLVLPALVSFLGVDRRTGEGRAVRWLQGRYDRIGSRGGPRAAVAFAVVAVLVGVGLLPFLSTSAMPALREPGILITFDGADGAAGPAMSRITAAAATELRALPGVSGVSGTVGRAVLSDQVADVNVGEIWVRIAPDADHDATLAAVQEVVDGYPGLRRSVGSYLDGRTDGLLTATESQLRVRVYGENSEVLAAKAGEVQNLLGGVAGLRDPVVAQAPLRPTVQIEVDLAKAQQFNIKPGDVRRTAATLLAGLEVGSLFEDQKVFEVVVWGTPAIRQSITGVENLLVDRPDGAGQVRIGDVAQVRVAPAPAVISRDASSRYLDVIAAVDGRGYSAVAADVRAGLAGITFPFEHRAEIVGDYSAGQDALWRMIGVALVALVLIYLVLQAAMRSWWLATIAVVLVPVALSGALVATALAGRVVSIGTVVGLLAVAAIALRQILDAITRYQELGRSGAADDVTRERVGTIVATALAIAVAVLPIVVAGPIAGLELLHPMAVAVLGGIVTTTAVALFVLPWLYLVRSTRADDTEADDPLPPTPSDELVGSQS